MMNGANGPIMAGVWERVNGKGFVYYPKKAWDASGYKIPTTYEELKTLMDQMVTDGTTPWCIGIESGAATGWVATDWMENIMLRTTTPENYDAWVQGKLAFTSPEVTNAAADHGRHLDRTSTSTAARAAIVKTSFGDSTLPMFDAKGPKCFMNMNGNFITSFFPRGLEGRRRLRRVLLPAHRPAVRLARRSRRRHLGRLQRPPRSHGRHGILHQG